MPNIQQLPTSVVNKIAAGEVIERPASVVKELVENSVDAGATRIDVTVEQGGSDLIRIADNGCGIAPEQLTLAVASHATSKIVSADDLFQVQTLGFRGEALASVAEISHFRLRSRTPESDAGAEMAINGGQMVENGPCGCPVGTTIEVRNLFFNTPVRKKFMRTTQTEFGHISEALTRIALAHPQIHFTLKHGNRQVYDLPANHDLKERIGIFFGQEIAENLIEVSSGDGQVELVGYVGNPRFSRSNNRMQYLFLNGRHIRDRALQHALGEAYRGLLLTGRYPIAFLRLRMPPDMVDVNVHPTKLEVRFQDSGRIYSQLLGTLRTQFLSSDLTATYGASGEAADATPKAHDSGSAQALRNELVAWAKGAVPEDAENRAGSGGGSGSGTPRGKSQTDFELDFRSPRYPPLELTKFNRDDVLSRETGHTGEPFAGSKPGTTHRIDPAETSSDASTGPPRHGVGREQRGIQLHNRYLIAETDEGMVIIDQHALHERILYEEIREKVLAQRLETQRLLVPETLNLSPAEYAAVEGAVELFQKIGIELEPFGGDTFLVRGYPAMLDRKRPQEIVREMIDHLLEGGKQPDSRDLLDDLLHMMSCKAAVKAGDRLSTEEIDALLDLRHLCQDAHHCPHGRPTALVFTNEELDRRFQRI